MSTTPRARSSARRFAACGLSLLALAAALGTGCVGDANPGVDPPPDGLFFPSGLLLDPRGADDEPASYLLVANGNNDLAFNAATITAIDLRAFYEAWEDDEFGVYPYCEDVPTEGRALRRCVLDRGSTTTPELPCRRLQLLPQVVECDEVPFVVDSVRLGDFATVLDASRREPDGVPRVWVPVRGGPSITYIDVEDGPGGTPDLDCGQGRLDGEASDHARCADDHRLTHLRNDEDLLGLDREPFNIHIDEFVPEGETEPAYRYGYVAHSAGGTLTLIDLDGIGGAVPGSLAPTRPAIVDAQPVFIPIGFSTGASPGGFGLASRPCSNLDVDDDGLPDNSPSLTLGCTRPLVYGSYRFQLNLTSFTAGGIDGPPLPDGEQSLDDCFDAQGGFVGPFCAGPDDLGKPCTIVCDPQVVGARPFLPGGVDPFAPTAAAALGDIAFSDPEGETLYAVQTNPGALLEVDTSLDLDSEPLDVPSAPPIELCDQPTRMKLWRDEGLAFVSCFRAALVYVVDLRAHRVVETVVTGTGPHDLVVDEIGEKLYVANSLEGSVSVIELDATRPSYLKELARIGLQEPFSQ